MATKDAFIAELKHESSVTKKLLERVPMEQKDWKPHERSMTLARLASHVADTPKWASRIAAIDDFDFTKNYTPGKTAQSSEELLQVFGDSLDEALKSLESMEEEDFTKMWTARVGDKVMMTLPKKVAIRGWAFSHMIHHRGQLSVYLRLLNVPVPGMYGPSADES